MPTNKVFLLYSPSPRWGLDSNTSCWGRGKGPLEISQTTGPISKFQASFDSSVRELPVQGQNFDPKVTDDVSGQVKVRNFDFSGLVTSSSKISILKGQSQLVKGRPIYSNDCGKYSLCQLDHAQQRKSDTTLYFRHKFIF